MQGKQKKSMACTAWLVAGALAPMGAVIARPFAIVGAAIVLFAFVVAAVELRH